MNLACWASSATGRFRRLTPFRRAGALLAVFAAGALPAASPGGGAPTIGVASEWDFQRAVALLSRSGGMIVLHRGSYGELVVPPRGPRPLRIVGARGVRIERILLDRTQWVSLGGMTVAPVSQDAWVEVDRSHDVDLHDLLVTAQGTRLSASVTLPDASRVTIRRSEFTHCGDRAPAFANCLLMSRASDVTVADSWFHDCLGCDFVHGRFGNGLTLRGNRFERTLTCRILPRRCGHQDDVELFEGRYLRVEGNRFGVYQHGGAQLYLTNAIDHVRIVNNVFLGTDPLVPGYHSRVGLIVGARGTFRVPHDVRIVNNTILTGARRIDGYLGSIRMSSAYRLLPRRERPVLANNVIVVLDEPKHVCAEVGISSANVVLRGRGCSASDAVGDAALTPDGRPTARSILLIDRGDRRYAPALDLSGRRRDAAPDVGAFEFR